MGPDWSKAEKGAEVQASKALTPPALGVVMTTAGGASERGRTKEGGKPPKMQNSVAMDQHWERRLLALTCTGAPERRSKTNSRPGTNRGLAGADALRPSTMASQVPPPTGGTGGRPSTMASACQGPPTMQADDAEELRPSTMTSQLVPPPTGATGGRPSALGSPRPRTSPRVGGGGRLIHAAASGGPSVPLSSSGPGRRPQSRSRP